MLWLLYTSVLAVGLAIPPGSVDDGMAGLLVTFFGLVAAGIIPAMSLLVGNVLSPTRSVARIISLKADLDTLLRQLSGMLMAVISGGICVIVLSFGVPALPIDAASVPAQFSTVAAFVVDLPTRFLQALTFVSLFLAVDRMRVVKEAFKAVLDARFELAVEEARRFTNERAPSPAAVKDAFPTPSGFGLRVDLSSGEDTSR